MRNPHNDHLPLFDAIDNPIIPDAQTEMERRYPNHHLYSSTLGRIGRARQNTRCLKKLRAHGGIQPLQIANSGWSKLNGEGGQVPVPSRRSGPQAKSLLFADIPDRRIEGS